jgi:hypothetical protein
MTARPFVLFHTGFVNNFSLRKKVNSAVWCMCRSLAGEWISAGDRPECVHVQAVECNTLKNSTVKHCLQLKAFTSLDALVTLLLKSNSRW